MHRLAPKAARAASATSRSLSTTTPARLSATAPAFALNPNAPDVPDFAQKKRERKRAVPGKVPDKNVGKDARKHAFHPSPHAPAKAPIFQEWHVPELVVPTIQTVKKAPGAGAFDTSRPEHPFNHFGLPKKQIAEFRLLSKPASVVREITTFTRDLLDKAANGTSGENHRLAITGATGSGKSFLLLQAVDYCAANGWVVLYFPRSYNLVNSTTAHVYDIRTRTFAQPNYAYGTLKRLLATNAPQLAKLRTTRAHASASHRFDVPEGTPLAELARLALKDQPMTLAPVALDMLLEELGKQEDVPVLVAADDMQALCGQTLYKDPQFRSIAAWHLGMPRLLLEFAGGMRKFKRGAFVGAVTNSDPLFPVPAELLDAFEMERSYPASPYDRRRPEVMEYIDGIMQLRVPERFNIEEAMAVYELWAGAANVGSPASKTAERKGKTNENTKGKKGAEAVDLVPEGPRLQMRGGVALEGPTDEGFLQRFTESGGNPRAFVWQGVLGSLQTSTAAIQATSGPVLLGMNGAPGVEGQAAATSAPPPPPMTAGPA
ncbi:mitochondrial ribosomal death-associated protein 3-domain-containing protein [Schizophyllum commune]